LTNREISRELASRIGRITSLAAGIKLAAGKTNAPGISAGRDGSLQQDIEHDGIPLISCLQSMGSDSCEAAGCDLWWWCSGMLQKPPAQQSTPYAKSAAPAIGAYKSATASRQSHAAANRTRSFLFVLTRTRHYTPIPHN